MWHDYRMFICEIFLYAFFSTSGKLQWKISLPKLFVATNENPAHFILPLKEILGDLREQDEAADSSIVNVPILLISRLMEKYQSIRKHEAFAC